MDISWICHHHFYRFLQQYFMAAIVKYLNGGGAGWNIRIVSGIICDSWLAHFSTSCLSLSRSPLAPPAGRKKEGWIFHEDGELGEAADGGVWKCTVRFGPQAAVAFDIKESLHVGFVYEGKIVRNGSLIHIQAEQQNIYIYACRWQRAYITHVINCKAQQYAHPHLTRD